jgi:hypothetical protein
MSDALDLGATPVDLPTDYLPPGVHPTDPSIPGSIVPPAGDQPGPMDAGTPQTRNKPKPWTVPNEDALPVFERASKSWSGNTINLSTTNAFQLVGRVKGRKAITIWVPAAATHGVILAPTEGEAQEANGVTLNPGDSVTLDTEAPVYICPISGQTTGTCNYVTTFNPAGSLGAD